MSRRVNIVFDFGGVLFDWQPHGLIARLLPKWAATLPDAQASVDEFFGGFGGDWREFDRGTLTHESLAERIAARTGLTLSEVVGVIDAVPHELRPMPGMVPQLLHRLQARGHALYFLSNMPAAYADHLEAHHDFLAMFRAGVFSARVQRVKPEAEVFDYALQVFGTDASDTLLIDDLQANTDAARAAGWKALRFYDAAQCKADLVRLGVLQPLRGVGQ